MSQLLGRRSSDLGRRGARHSRSDLTDLLLGERVLRAVELDINPEWVAAYLYDRRGSHGPLVPVPVAPGQPGVPGQFLASYSRDFFIVMTR